MAAADLERRERSPDIMRAMARGDGPTPGIAPCTLDGTQLSIPGVGARAIRRAVAAPRGAVIGPQPRVLDAAADCAGGGVR